MAHIKLREDPGTNIRLLYLNDAAVGPGSPNRREDVLLIQFFLNALWGTSPDKKTVIGSGAAPVIDGVCGNVTNGAIVTFQRWYWEQPPRGGFTDGRVEPLPVGQQLGPLHSLPYTIIGLNANFGLAFSPDRHSRLGKEPKFPAELRRKLFV